MRGKRLASALAVFLTVGLASGAVAQRVSDRVVVIQPCAVDNGNAQEAHVQRGQVLSVCQRANKRLYVVIDSNSGNRQPNYGFGGWIDEASVLSPAKAVPHFSECLKKDPKDAGAYFGRAGAANALGQHDRVIADCTELLRLDPKSVAAYYLRGCAWQAKDHVEKAIADFSDVVRLDPQRADIYRLRGELWQKQKKYAEAIADYSRLLKLTPNQVDAYYCRSIARYEMREYRQALDDINEMLVIQPDAAMAYRARGMVLCRLREFDRAEDDFNEALRLRRLETAQMCHQGWYWFLQGNVGYSWMCFGQFHQSCEACADDLMDRSDCHAARGEPQNALTDCEEALSIAPASVRGLHQRGLLRMEKQQYTAALADFDAALKLDPKFALMHHILCGGCRAEMGQYDKALADFEDAVRLEPDNAQACNSQAWFLATCDDARHRDGKRAVELATKACRGTNWDSSSYIDTLAAADAEAGDFAEAVRWQEKAVETAVPASKAKMIERLALYRAHKPYHEAAKAEAGTTAGVKKGK